MLMFQVQMDEDVEAGQDGGAAGVKKKKKRFPLASVDFSIPVMLTLGEAWKRL